MKILQVHTRYREMGGEDTVVRAEAELLRNGGHQVVEWEAHNPSSPLQTIGALAVSARNPRTARAAGALVGRERPEVAHVHNTWFALSPSVLGGLRRAGTPVVMTLHNYRLMCTNAMLFRDGRPCEDCVGTHPWHGVVHRCYRGSALASTVAAANIAWNHFSGTWERDVDLFVALTGFAKQRFVAGGLAADRIVVKPHFAGDPGPRLAPPSDSPVVLYVGRLSPEKGVDVLLDAWAALAPAHLELVLVGDGPSRAELEAREVPGVRFVGWVSPEEVSRRLLGARALVFPSVWYETFGLVMVEAMAAGLPVAASDLGGTREVLGEGGWLVRPREVDAWAKALGRLEDGEDIDAAGRRGRARYEERYMPSVALQALEAMYRKVTA